ncbi:MAG: TIGR02300 family protein [Pseudomonadota bacterium]
MPKEEWGVKRVCPTTGKRFYDMGRNPIVSPYTGEVVEIDTGKGSRTLVADKAEKAPKPEAEEDSEELVLDDDADLELDADDDVELDDDEVLEDDDEDTVSLDELADVGGGDDED